MIASNDSGISFITPVAATWSKAAVQLGDAEEDNSGFKLRMTFKRTKSPAGRSVGRLVGRPVGAFTD